MKILDGKKLSIKLLAQLKRKTANKKIKLAIVLVGENPASKIFVRQKEKACNLIGVGFEFFNYPATISENKLEKEMVRLSNNPKNSGIVIQLPLPKTINSQKVLNCIDPKKDVDVLTETNLGKFYIGNSLLLPPVVGAIRHLLKQYKIGLKGKRVALFGVGNLVGFPTALWLFREEATVFVINKFTRNVSEITKNADIIISGVGKAGLIKGDLIKKGAIIIDAECSFKNGKLSGGVDFQSASKRAKYITPVPGGIGPMTVACLLENLFKI